MALTDSSDAPPKIPSLPNLGEHIRQMRKARGLTQDNLAGPEFTKGYVSALERGAVRPSLKALDVFARRLGVPISDFLSTPDELSRELDVEAQREDFLYQCNYAKMLMRSGKMKDAMRLMDEVAEAARSYHKALPPDLAYLIPFLRGRAHLQSYAPKPARIELEAALEIAKGNEEATARVRNLLGLAFFEMNLPQLAVEQHVECMRSIHSHAIKDPNFRVSVYRNLANDYWALNDPVRAIKVYEEALPALQDLSDMEQQARVFWGMSLAYEKLNDKPQAKLYGLRALHIFEVAENRIEAAAICLNLAGVMLGQEKYNEAAELLGRAECFAKGTGNQATMSYVHRNYANLARKQGQLDKALEHVKESVSYAAASYEATRVKDKSGNHITNDAGQWQDPTRTYAEALQMEALIAEASGRTESADETFLRALALLHDTSFEETRHAISFSYAEVLQARGAFEQAMNYYRASAQFRPHAYTIVA